MPATSRVADSFTDPDAGNIDAAASRISSATPVGLFVLVVSGVLGVGALDYVTGAEISISIFYLIPIFFAAWTCPRPFAIASALLGAAVWLVAEILTQPPFSHPWIPIWNAGARLAFFLLAVGWLSTLRRMDGTLRRAVDKQTAALRTQIAQRRALEREIAEVTASEQARIARDLHDGVGQYLAGLSFQARMLADDLHKENSSRAAAANRLVEQINRANRQTRRLDTILAPPIADAGGLPGALRQLVQEIESFAGVQCVAAAPETLEGVDSFQALNLFRIAQEALSNAIKHGSAGQVRIELTDTPAAVSLRIEDAGRGFAAGDAAASGSGLRIMRHRAELIGATLEIYSEPDRGCVVECRMPRTPPSRPASP